MKITRKKKLQRHLNFYCNNFGFRKPYQILIDGTICQTALKNQLNIKDQFPVYLEGDVKLLTTHCVVVETEKLGGIAYGAMVIIKQFGVHRCGHKKPISASACLQSMLGTNNSNRYILATQDRELQEVARTIPGTPLLYLHFKTPTLEQPSEVSYQHISQQTNAALSLSSHQQDTLKHLKKVVLGIEDTPEIVKRRKKKGGPNPLSCKKKKKIYSNNAGTAKSQSSEEGLAIRKTRKRKRNKTKRLQQ